MKAKFYENNKVIFEILLWPLILLIVYSISFKNFLLFHSLTEMFSVAVAFAIFILVWNTRLLLDNNFFLIVGVSYLFIGSLDLTHTLAYKGMGVFSTGDTNLPTQLWVAGRFLESITFLIAPFFINRKVKVNWVVLAYVAAFIVLNGSIFYWEIFPVCFVEGTGLTPFKKISEYIVSIVLLVSILEIFQKKEVFDRLALRYMIASIIITIITELVFTLYLDAYGVVNFIGHYLKVVSFYLIYKAIVDTSIRRPYDIIFRNLKQKERDLTESEVKYRSMMEALIDPVYICSPNLTITYMNPAMIARIGHDAVGENCYKALFGFEEKCRFCLFDKIGKGEMVRNEVFRQKDGRFYHVTHSPIFHADGAVSKLAIYRDITEIKQSESLLRQERNRAQRYLDIVGVIIVVLNADETVSLINSV
jgi:PAS domain S-box-containing protein